MLHPHVHVPYHRIEDYLTFIKANRINLEIFISSESLDEINNSHIISLKEKLDYNPSLTIHAPFMDLSPGAVDRKVRAVTIERFTRIFDIAGILKPEAIVFHSGYEKWKYALKVDVWLEKSLKTWELFTKRAEEMEIKIAIENIFEDEPTNLRLLMEKMSSSNFGLCFDTGHFNLFSKIPLAEWLEQLKEYILELHLHDNDKSFDAHLAIGDGTFDFDTLFATLNNKKLIYTIEGHSKDSVLKSLARLKTYSVNLK
jgi:sugar phosphate isomerase/epimerase